MSQENHIHIIASGENIHNTFPHAINEFKMSKAIVIVEKNVYDNPQSNRNPKIIESIQKVEEISKLTKKTFVLKIINSISLNDIRDVVLDIVNENPQNSTYYFNVTGGTKVLSNGLFMMAIWLDSNVYHVGENEVLQRLVIPKIHTADIIKNPNYIAILEALEKAKNHEKLRKDLFTDLKLKYIPLRVNNKKLKRSLSPGTLSKWTNDLIMFGLIEEKYLEGNKKEKIIKITDDGIFTLKFIKATSTRLTGPKR